jgi:hypothetical protein
MTTFGLPTEEGAISCKLASHLLEPHFEVPPVSCVSLSFSLPMSNVVDTSFVSCLFTQADLRVLSRKGVSDEDKEKGQTIVREGGERCRLVYFSLRTWNCTLLHSPQEFFDMQPLPSSLDGATAILLLQSCHGS